MQILLGLLAVPAYPMPSRRQVQGANVVAGEVPTAQQTGTPSPIPRSLLLNARRLRLHKSCC